MVVKSDHPITGPCLDLRKNLICFGFPDQVSDGRGREHDLKGGNPAGPVDLGDKNLGDNSHDRSGKLDTNLGLLGRRENIDNAVHGPGRACRMKGRKNKVAGFGRADRGFHGGDVTHLAD
ncbi:MAG: hypothetical protein BWY42_01650 [Candidatus Omnitrophica bacterium ADurb.Bin277]|nr:MAG: hypothetical protein BWY42_01650 [Candidatus Omnitrophica bacterium ADurb.Bin277]